MRQTTKKAAARPKHRKLPIGARAKVRLSVHLLPVQIVEDRGMIGAGGRQLVRLRFTDPDMDGGTTFESAVDNLIFRKPRPAKSKKR